VVAVAWFAGCAKVRCTFEPFGWSSSSQWRGCSSNGRCLRFFMSLFLLRKFLFANKLKVSEFTVTKICFPFASTFFQVKKHNQFFLIIYWSIQWLVRNVSLWILITSSRWRALLNAYNFCYKTLLFLQLFLQNKKRTIPTRKKMKKHKMQSMKMKTKSLKKKI